MNILAKKIILNLIVNEVDFCKIMASFGTQLTVVCFALTKIKCTLYFSTFLIADFSTNECRFTILEHIFHIRHIELIK